MKPEDFVNKHIRDNMTKTLKASNMSDDEISNQITKFGDVSKKSKIKDIDQKIRDIYG